MVLLARCRAIEGASWTGYCLLLVYFPLLVSVRTQSSLELLLRLRDCKAIGLSVPFAQSKAHGGPVKRM